MLKVQDIPERFFLDIAIGALPVEDICLASNLKPKQVEALETDPLFRRRLAQAEQAVLDDGSAFRARCRTAAHGAIAHIECLVKDTQTPPSVRHEIFKTLTKIGDLEVQPKDTSQTAGPGLSLTIVAPGGARIEHNITPESTQPALETSWLEVPA